jgi:ABC-type oligopeptide transport system substrate-binding subunit
MRVIESRLAPAGEVDRIILARGSDLFHWGWAEPLDSANIFRSLYHGGAAYAAPGVASPELDALIDAAEAEPTTFGRDELIGRLWKRVLGDVLYVPTYRVVSAWAMHAPLDLPLGVNLRPQFRFASYDR